MVAAQRSSAAEQRSRVVKIKSIATEFILAVVVVVGLSVAAIVLYANHAIYQLELANNTAFMNKLADSLVQEIDDFSGEGVSIASSLAGQRGMMNAAVRDTAYIVNSQLRDIVKSNDRLDTVLLFNRNGKVVSGFDANGQKLRGKIVKDEPYFSGIANGDEAFVDKNLTPSPFTGATVMNIAAPVTRGGELVGGILVCANWDRFAANDILSLTIGTNGYPIVFDQNMRTIAHPDPALMFNAPRGSVLEQQIQNVGNGTTEYTFAGVTKLGVFRRAEGMGWSVLLNAPKAELLVKVTAIRNVLLCIGAAAILFVIIVMGVLFRRLVVRPLAAINTFSERVAAGDLSATLSGSFTHETARLASHITAMTEELKSKLSYAQGILGGIAMPCAVADTAERITFLNAAMVDAVGRTGAPEDFHGMTTGEFAFGDASRPTVLGKALKENTQIANEMDFVTQQGHKRVYSVVSTPIHDMNGASTGAMTMWFDLTEVRQQQHAIEEQSAVIADVASRASSVSTQVASASEELSAQVEQSSRGAQEQRHMASEAAAAIEQMNASVLEVARNATSAAEVAERTRTTAGEGTEVITAVIEGFEEVTSDFASLDTSMQALSEQAAGISTIVQVIEDIADQTNLLALNAAIEAARAGEAGRGFAVVADEVRKLAEKTMSATKEVGHAVKSIQNSTATTVDGMHRSQQVMEGISAHTANAVAALESIRGMVEETTAQVQSIASAAEEQSAASEEISHSAGDINRIAGETAEAMGHSSTSVTQLAQLASDLQEMIASVKQ